MQEKFLSRVGILLLCTVLFLCGNDSSRNVVHISLLQQFPTNNCSKYNYIATETDFS